LWRTCKREKNISFTIKILVEQDKVRKHIALRQCTYERLKNIGRKGQRFDDVITQLLKNNMKQLKGDEPSLIAAEKEHITPKNDKSWNSINKG
jgi:predicted CopG family antitoxin